MAESSVHCAKCNAWYRVKAYDAAKSYTCPKCKGPLKPEDRSAKALEAKSGS